MSEKSLSKNTRKNVILLHIAVMCFSFSGVIGQYVQVPAVQVAMGRVICSSLLLLAISLVCKDKLTLDSKKDYGLMIMTGVVMAIHWSSFFQSIQTSSVAIGTITFSTFPLFLTFLEPLLFHEKIRGRNILNALILLLGVLITIPEFSVENKVTVGIIWGMIASFTYAVMTLSNRYFANRYKGRTICLYEQGTAAVALLPALGLVKASGGFCRSCNDWLFVYGNCIFFICDGAKGCESTDSGNYLRNGDGVRHRICTSVLKRDPDS